VSESVRDIIFLAGPYHGYSRKTIFPRPKALTKMQRGCASGAAGRKPSWNVSRGSEDSMRRAWCVVTRGGGPGAALSDGVLCVLWRCCGATGHDERPVAVQALQGGAGGEETRPPTQAARNLLGGPGLGAFCQSSPSLPCPGSPGAPCVQAASAVLIVTVTAPAAVSRLLLYRRGSSAPMDRGTSQARGPALRLPCSRPSATAPSRRAAVDLGPCSAHARLALMGLPCTNICN